jgi:amino acid transporter
MSSAASTASAPQPPDGSDQGAKPASPAGQKQSGGLGLTSATGLVIGSIIGTGVFTMPAVLAAAGTSSLIVLAVVGVGAMLLAIMFGQLTKRVPKADGGLYSCIGIAASVALFSFIGVEVAAMTAKRVKNPPKNVGRASVIGTGISATLYLLVSAAVMGLVSHHALLNNGAPFVNAFQTIFPHGTWAGKLIAATAVVSGIGALNGWTLVTTECSRAPADDGLFPKAFAWNDRNGTAWFGIVIAALLPSLLMLWRYTSSSGLTVFTYLVDLTVVTVAIPYLFSACAQLTYLVSRRRQVQGWPLARDLLICGVSALFSLWVTFASGYQAVYSALVVVLAGVILYAFLNARREDAGKIPDPVDNPPDAGPVLLWRHHRSHADRPVPQPPRHQPHPLPGVLRRVQRHRRRPADLDHQPHRFRPPGDGRGRKRLAVPDHPHDHIHRHGRLRRGPVRLHPVRLTSQGCKSWPSAAGHVPFDAERAVVPAPACPRGVETAGQFP